MRDLTCNWSGILYFDETQAVFFKKKKKKKIISCQELGCMYIRAKFENLINV